MHGALSDTNHKIVPNWIESNKFVFLIRCTTQYLRFEIYFYLPKIHRLQTFFYQTLFETKWKTVFLLSFHFVFVLLQRIAAVVVVVLKFSWFIGNLIVSSKLEYAKNQKSSCSF